MKTATSIRKVTSRPTAMLYPKGRPLGGISDTLIDDEPFHGIDDSPGPDAYDCCDGEAYPGEYASLAAWDAFRINLVPELND